MPRFRFFAAINLLLLPGDGHHFLQVPSLSKLALLLGINVGTSGIIVVSLTCQSMGRSNILWSPSLTGEGSYISYLYLF
jgi:hypothetical protein